MSALSAATATDRGMDPGRRRWLKGMLTGPAVVSLPSTASAAAFGSISSCVENGISTKDIPLHIGMYDPSDGYARSSCVDAGLEAMVIYKGNPDAKGNGYREDYLVRYKTGRLLGRDWIEWFDNGNGKVTSLYGETMTIGDRIDRQCLMFAQVDDIGEFVTANPDSTAWGALPVSGSCYMSIAAFVG